MKTVHGFAMLAVVGLGAGLVLACSGGDDDSGGGGAGGSTGGATGSGTGGTSSSGTVAGSCAMSGLGQCMTYECAGTTCGNVQQYAASNCPVGGGVWATGTACSPTGSVGSCRVAGSAGDTISTYYSGSGLTAAAVQAACTQSAGTYVGP